jgi:hypothetical protein
MAAERVTTQESLVNETEMHHELTPTELDPDHYESSYKAEMFGLGLVLGLIAGAVLGVLGAVLYPPIAAELLILGVGFGAGTGVLAGTAMKERAERNTVERA